MPKIFHKLRMKYDRKYRRNIMARNRHERFMRIVSEVKGGI
jgi:hypothetical protein